MTTKAPTRNRELAQIHIARQQLVTADGDRYTITDKGHEIAGITSVRLLSADMPNGILPGPRSPKYQAR